MLSEALRLPVQGEVKHLVRIDSDSTSIGGGGGEILPPPFDELRAVSEVELPEAESE